VRRAAPVPAVPPRRRGQRGGQWVWVLVRLGLIAAIWGALALTGVVLWLSRDLPRPESALDAARRPSLTLLDRSGRLIATYGDVVGDSLRLTELPAYVPAAVVSVEDRRFWSHPGIDLIGMARALTVDLIAGRVVQGGSTVTQQVAKTLFLSNARTLHRKVLELLLTLWLERTFTKTEILEIWLNRVYFGAGTWGIDAAARLYFGISARKLSLWQAAVLAGLPRAPSRFNPRTDPGAAIARGKEVLAAMVEAGAIDTDTARAAAAQIVFPPRPAAPAGWFADWAAEQAQAAAQNADAVVRTTLDPHLQAVAEGRLAATLDGPGAAAGVTQGAVVVLDATDGAVRAMVGGRDYRLSPFNRAVAARRQPGSAFKPFVWLAALESGVRPDDAVLDAPIRIGKWSPVDFENRYLGVITVEEALAQSINTAAVRLMQEAGGARVVARLAHRLGIADALPETPSLALGTGEVGLLELAGAYAAFFNGGVAVSLTAIGSVTVNGNAAAPIQPAPAPVMEPDLAAMMARMLGAVVARGTGRAAAVPGRTVAGKTGTTQDYRDAWFVGDVGNEIIGVWLGNDDNTPMQHVVGGGLPARLFHDVAVEVR
jgi:penicillin-binding protein 1A